MRLGNEDISLCRFGTGELSTEVLSERRTIAMDIMAWSCLSGGEGHTKIIRFDQGDYSDANLDKGHKT